jgi:surface carbohydrate biosynthesis protein (TIGR04326 family)
LSTEHATACGVALGLNGGNSREALPSGWQAVSPDELLDAHELKRRFFEFLEAWPQAVAARGHSFNRLFTVDGNYSLWWTSVAADRQVTHGIFTYFRYAALVDEVIERLAPKTVLLFTKDPLCSALVRSRADKAGVVVRAVAGCAAPARRDVALPVRWLARCLQHALSSALERLVLAIKSRWQLRSAQLFRASGRPTVVFASTWPRHLAVSNGEFALLYWREISAAFETVAPSMVQAFLPRKLSEIVDAGTSVKGLGAVRDVRAPLVIWERFFPFRSALPIIGRQIAAAWRFFLLARRPQFQEAFQFAGADMAPVLMPRLKDAVTRVVDWSFKRAQVANALRAIGNVRAVVVSEEMYRHAMPTLAAAAALRIPTIGVQHGTINPTHLMYALPRGHVEHAPVPDYFGAYGDYAKEVLSMHGAFPGERVWIAGAPRLDPLINQARDQSAARAALNLPSDKPIVVLATQTFHWFESAVRAVLESMREYPGAVLCVKKNPSVHAMSLAQIERIAAELGVSGIRGFEGHTDLLLAACSVWISASSTTILEATLLGRPTICVNFSGHPDRYPYVLEGVSLPARSIDELQRSLERVLTDPDTCVCERRRKAFLNRHVGPTTEGRGALTFTRRLTDIATGRPQ